MFRIEIEQIDGYWFVEIVNSSRKISVRSYDSGILARSFAQSLADVLGCGWSETHKAA